MLGNNKKEKTKKEHFVPRCYLERWKSDKGQVWVYDKKLKKSRLNNVYDVACERYFYDIDYKELSAQKIKLLKELGIEVSQDEQFLEHFFSRYVEGVFSDLLSKILDVDITPWYEKECFFLSERDKLDLSIFASFQYIRTVETRRMLKDMSNCLEQVLREMKVSDEVIDKYTMKDGDERNIHGNMILDIDHIRDMALCFYNLTWILGINRTSVDFYTSDNPIGTIPHVKNDFISMSGIRSEGVEVFFPLSPKHILIMYDGSYHKWVAPYDRRYVSIDEIDWVQKYNRRSVYNCNRCVFSKDGDLSVVDKISKENPQVLDIPKTRLSWGGKDFLPK